MGQKANPNAIRLGINRSWDAKWYPSNKSDFSNWLIEDKKIRKYFVAKEREYFIGKLVIERNQKNKLIINIHTSHPGIVLGREGKNIEKINIDIKKLIKDRNRKVELNVIEINNPDLNAKLVANEIALALENRTPFRIIQKKLISRVMKAGAKGIKTQVSGRLNGVDMARSEGYSKGVVPLQTFRNEIDFAISEAHTTYGVLGVKIWISRDKELENKQQNFNKRSNSRNYSKNNNSNNNNRNNNFKNTNGSKNNQKNGGNK